MTGRPGDPRASTSVNDIMGLFGAIGVLGALIREASPAGMEVNPPVRTTCS
jgi:hypothetical protein